MYPLQVGVGDFVSVCPEDEKEAVYIAQIVALWEDTSSTHHRKQFHARWFSRSSDTVLGEVRERDKYMYMYMYLCTIYNVHTAWR